MATVNDNVFVIGAGAAGVTEISAGTSGTERPSQWLVDFVRGGPGTSAGIPVNAETALTYSACWCATRILAESVASLPLILYRGRRGGGRRTLALDHALFDILEGAPNPEMDSMTFVEMLTAWLVNWGNAYAEIERAIDGTILALWPIHPSRVSPRRLPDGRIVFLVKYDGIEEPQPIEAGDMFHLVGALSDDGLTGRGVIRQARESIGLGLATERFGATFFANGARPGGVIKHPAPLTQPEFDRLRSSWKEGHEGVKNAHRVAILEGEGSDFVPLGVPPEDAQFLETRQHNVTEIARWYRVPPHMLADLSRATFSNIESQGIDFVTHSLMAWLTRWERAIRRQLLTPAERPDFYAKFDVDRLLRGDTPTRTNALATQFLNGALTLNQWAEIEDRDPLPKYGDLHFVPLNLTTIDRVATGQAAQPAPAGQADGPGTGGDRRGGQPGDMPHDGPPAGGGDMPHDGPAGPMMNATRAARAFLADSLARMIRAEGNAAKAASYKPGEFLGWLDKFYAKHSRTMAAVIRPAVACCLEQLRDASDPGLVADRVTALHVERAREELLRAAECSAAELPDRVAAAVAAWDGRPHIRIGSIEV